MKANDNDEFTKNETFFQQRVKGQEHLLAILTYILIYIQIYTWTESATNFIAFMSLIFIWYCAIVVISKQICLSTQSRSQSFEDQGDTS